MKIDCKHCREELASRRPEQPPPEAVHEHLRACADCRTWLEQDARVWRLLGQVEPPQAPARLVDSIVTGVLRPRRRERTVFRFALAGAALVGALLGIWLGIGLSLPQEPPRAPEEIFAEEFDAVSALGLGYTEESSGRLP